MSRYQDMLRRYRPTAEELAQENRPAKLARALDALEQADSILIGGAAGLSAAGGIDYLDAAVFRNLCPALWERGLRTLWDATWYPHFTQEEKWLLRALELIWACFDYPVAQVYRDLYQLVQGKNYFVLTSNGDNQFYKAGFDPARILAPQGDSAMLQCCVPCTQRVWSGETAFRRIAANADHRAFRCRAQDIPVCPQCGGPVRQNVRGDQTFVSHPTMATRPALERFVAGAKDEKIVFFELGAGFNSPGMIRHPFQRLTRLYPHATLLRLNLDYPKVPAQIEDKSVWFGGDLAQTIADLLKQKGL